MKEYITSLAYVVLFIFGLCAILFGAFIFIELFRDNWKRSAIIVGSALLLSGSVAWLSVVNK